MFLPFELAGQRGTWSVEACTLADAIAALRLPNAVFLRGSVVESHAPFRGADVDIIVVGDGRCRFQDTLRLRACTRRPVDLKVLNNEELAHDPIQMALLAHRSVQVSGNPRSFAPVRAGAHHAWQHWLACFPAGLPPTLDTADRFAVQHFKLAARAFGVLGLLAWGRFTRDVGASLEVAAELDPQAWAVLSRVQRDLESGALAIHDLRRLRQSLARLYDTYICCVPSGDTSGHAVSES